MTHKLTAANQIELQHQQAIVDNTKSVTAVQLKKIGLVWVGAEVPVNLR